MHGLHERRLWYPHCNPQRSFQWDCEWSLRIFEVPAKIFEDLTGSFKLSQRCSGTFEGTWMIYVTVSCRILYRLFSKNSCRIFTRIPSIFGINDLKKRFLQGTHFSKGFLTAIEPMFMLCSLIVTMPCLHFMFSTDTLCTFFPANFLWSCS